MILISSLLQGAVLYFQLTLYFAFVVVKFLPQAEKKRILIIFYITFNLWVLTLWVRLGYVQHFRSTNFLKITILEEERILSLSFHNANIITLFFGRLKTKLHRGHYLIFHNNILLSSRLWLLNQEALNQEAPYHDY